MPNNKKPSKGQNDHGHSEIWDGPLDRQGGNLNGTRLGGDGEHHFAGPPHRRHPRPPHHRHPGPPHHHRHHRPAHGQLESVALFHEGPPFVDLSSDSLNEVLSTAVVRWLFRAASFGPPEMMAIFKVQLSNLQILIDAIKASGKPLPVLLPDDLQRGDVTLQSLSNVLSHREAEHCLDRLFLGPEEVQAIAFISLVTLRLQFSLVDTGLDEEMK